MSEPQPNPTETPNSDGGTDNGLATLLDSSEGSGEQSGEQGQQPAEGGQEGGEQPPEAGEQTQDGDGEAAPGAPETYELTAPDGSELGGQVLEHFSEQVARKLNLTQDNAQMVIDTMAPVVQQQVAEQQLEAMRKQHDEMLNETRNDPEFGGDNLKSNLGKVGRALKALDPSGELSGLLKTTGLGSNLQVLKALAKAGDLVSEDDSLVVGAGGAGGERRTADILFGDVGKK